MKTTPAQTVIWDARPARGKRVLLVGFGCIGELIGWLTQGMPGIEPRYQ